MKRILQVVNPTIPVLPVMGTFRVWVPCDVFREAADPSCVSIFVGQGRINFLNPELVQVKGELPEVSMGPVNGQIQADVIAWNMRNQNFLLSVPALLPKDRQEQIWVLKNVLPDVEVNISYPILANITYFSSDL